MASVLRHTLQKRVGGPAVSQNFMIFAHLASWLMICLLSYSPFLVTQSEKLIWNNEQVLHLLTRKVGACYLKTPFKLTKIVIPLIIKHKSWLALDFGKYFNSKYKNGVDFLKLSGFSQFSIGDSASQSLRISCIAIHGQIWSTVVIGSITSRCSGK